MQDINQIKENVVSIVKRYPVRRAGLFGSVLRDDFNEDSDIDILVDIDTQEGFDLFDLIAMKQEIQEKLQRKVDLVDYGRIKPAYKKYILPSEVRIYEQGETKIHACTCR